jgi:recombination protein RecA
MAKSKPQKPDDENNKSKDEMLESLIETANKTITDQGKVAFILGDEGDTTTVTDWISTGNSLLDLAISNRPYGGVPSGRITEVSGLEASGKSLLIGHILAETQRKGGQAVLFDTESALDPTFLTAIGVDTSKLMTLKAETIEDIFTLMENLIAKVRSSNKNRLVTFAIDSIAGASTKGEQEESFEKEGYGTGKAYLLSKALRKVTNLISNQRICLVCTNQLREKIGFVGLGDKYITPGGKALPFHSSVRLRLKPEGQIKDSSGDVIGIKTKAVVVKNRFGPPFRSAMFNIYFASGIDDVGSWLEVLDENGIFNKPKIEKIGPDGKKKTKAQIELEKAALKKEKSCQFDYTDETLDTKEGDPVNLIEKVTFEKNQFKKLMKERPELKEFLYMKICKLFMFKYKQEEDEEVEISQSGDGMEE